MRYPEAGGSSSFARHAFNELASFGAAWTQMLNYIITIAISAYFVPHYLSIFWEPAAQDDAVGRDRRDRRDRDPRRAEHRRHQGGGEAQRSCSRSSTSRRSSCSSLARRGARLRPGRPRRATSTRRDADVEPVLPRDPDRDDRLHRHRDRLEPGRGGTRPAARHPALDLLGRDRGVRDLLHAAARSRSPRCRS